MDPLLHKIAQKFGIREFIERSSTIVRQGGKMPCMYYLLSGKVKIEQTAVNGKSILFAFSGEDSWLGDLELFGDNDEANCTVTAVTDIEALRFSLPVMRSNLRLYPGLAEIFGRSLAQKMWAYSRMSTVNILYPLLERYARYLYEMSAASPTLPIALETSAALLGAGERQLQRVLRTLAEQGIIKRSGHTLTVLDRDGLRRLASDLIQ